MQRLHFQHSAARAARGTRLSAIVGVVASGNLEILVERCLAAASCEVHVETPVRGFDQIWAAVIADFIEQRSPGGLRFSINDGGARPDTVALRLAQATRLMEQP
jgi:malonate decarboxylase delta subunit